VVRKFTKKTLAQVAEDLSLGGRQITGKEALILVDRWWSSFAGVDAKSSWKKARLYWHSFSFGCMPSLSGDAATKAFAAESQKQDVYLFSGEVKPTVLELSKRRVTDSTLNQLIATDRSVIDLYVVDVGFRWTFVRTHEECTGLGPFYSRADWLPAIGEE
jgi:hypothetical protein